MSEEKIKVIIADDHQLFRDGIRSLLQKQSFIDVVAEASDGKELLEKLKNHEADVALVDISMPEMSGLEVINKIKNDYPALRFIVLTMHKDGQYVMQSAKAGAHGYLLKNVDEEELIRAVSLVHEGERYYNSEIKELLVTNITSGEENKALSPREQEVLKLVASGDTTKMIADKLCVSTRTIETHRVNMMKKLKAQNTAELIKRAFELKLID